MHCIKSQRQVWTWCSCYLSRRFTQSKLDSCFFLCATLGRLGFWQLFGPHWHERLESLSRWKPGWPSWRFTKQIRQEVLTIRNDIADPSCICLRQTTSCTCSVSIQQHGRSVHTIICQGNAALFCQGIVLFRANSCQGFETTSAESIFEVTQTNIPALLGWDTSSAREA